MLRLATTSVAHHLPPTPPTPPDLAEVIDAWPILSEPIRAGIVAMVEASVKYEGH